MDKKKLGQSLRNEFPIFKNPLVYLDSAASAQKPKYVIDAMTNHQMNDYANVHRGAYDLSARSTNLYESARVKVANFLGSSIKPHQVIFTRGTTEGLNILASGLAQTVLTESSRIVIPMLEHHSNFVPWQQAALHKNCELAYIHLQGNQYKLNIDEAAKLITKSTQVVSFAHMGHVLGQINPIEKLIDLAKNVNALAIVDCAQSVTCLNQDLFSIGADAFVFSGHKIFGPTGIGVLVLSDDLANRLPPLIFGGGMVSAVTEQESQWASSPAKFEAGTPPITQAVGLTAALEWYEELGGKEMVHKHSAHLANLFVNGLKKNKKIEFFSPDTGHETIVSFRHKDMHAHDLSTVFDAHNIAVRSGHHCAWPLIKFLNVDSLCRASFSVYNDTDDVDFSLEILKNASLF